jgi:hypothetical protein
MDDATIFRKTAALALVALLIPVPSSWSAPKKSPRQPSAACAEISHNILADEMQMGALTAANIGEDSAARATMRNTEITSLYSSINTSISALRSRGCPAYPHVVSRSNFVTSALKCQVADLQAELGTISANPLDKMRKQIDAAGGIHPSDKADGPSPCDRSTWTRK